MAQLEKPTWVKMSEKQLKETVAELAQKNAPSKVGHILRDKYGIPSTKIFGKKLKAYYNELGIQRNEDLENAQAKVDSIKEHLKTNVTDRKAKHKLQKAQSRLNTTRKYFKDPSKNRE